MTEEGLAGYSRAYPRGYFIQQSTVCYVHIHRSIKLNNNIVTFIYLISIVVMMLFAMYHISSGVVSSHSTRFAYFCTKSLVKDIALLSPSTLQTCAGLN